MVTILIAAIIFKIVSGRTMIVTMNKIYYLSESMIANKK